MITSFLRTTLAVFSILIAGLGAIAAPLGPPTPLAISENSRYLVHTDGTPFFYLADTAWELFHRLDREEAELYLRNRADKGFTVIQAVALGELEGLTVGNAFNELPFIDMDASRPNEQYFAHVDWIVEKAASLGLYIGLLPSWGCWVGGNDPGQPNNDFINGNNAAAYGAYLAQRYVDKPIIWILGGDRMPTNSRAAWEAMAAGIRSVVGKDQLISYHPSLEYNGELHDAPWLDFTMIQSAHSSSTTNYVGIEREYARMPVKPCMDSEPAYEFPPGTAPAHIDVGPTQIRRNAYWAIFAGAHGHAYGTHPVWQMYDVGRKSEWFAQSPWHQNLDLPGVSQLPFLKRLMLSRPFLTRIPDQSVIASDIPQGLARLQATRDGVAGAQDATYLMVYFPQHARASINTALIGSPSLKGWWFNPRTGVSTAIEAWANAAVKEFETPNDQEDADWILIIDDGTKTYQAP